MTEGGFAITNKGRSLIAKLLAGDVLQISRVMFGSGRVADDVDVRTLTDLITPVAQGTSDAPSAKGGVVRMKTEYRSDLNGGLETGFFLNEFGVFAFDPDEGEVMIYYATLGDYPQWVSAYEDGKAVDVRRFPISIAIGEDKGVTVGYDTELWMTAEDVYSYFELTLMPLLDAEIDKKIAAHNVNEASHPYILGLINELMSRVSLLELMFSTNVSDNQFRVTFETLDAVDAAGNWNKDAARMEF